MYFKALPFLVYLSYTLGTLNAQSQISLVSDEQASVKNILDLTVQPYMVNAILDITGEKLNIKKSEMLFNNLPLKVKSCKIRGNTTLHFRRKSFSVSLNEPVIIDGTPVSKMAVNNLAMDNNYWRARLCFLLMKHLGIFPLGNQYSELRLNGQTQGTYLMIQKPEDYCRSNGSQLLLRRGNYQSLSIEYASGVDGKSWVKRLKNARHYHKKMSGKQLYDTLGLLLNIEQYQRWMAFNYLIMNGDYADELFLYLGPESGRFDIIPWDYDDIFASAPHEGTQRRNNALGEKLIFSSESELDMAIGQDDYLYQTYLGQLRNVINILTDKLIETTFIQVYRELTPFYLSPTIIEQSKYDQSGLTSIENLREDFSKHFQFLLRRRQSIYDTITLDSEQ